MHTRRFVLLLIFLASSWAMLVALMDGIDLRRVGFPLVSRDAQRPIAIAAALLLLYGLAFRASAASARRAISAAAGHRTLDVLTETAPFAALSLSLAVLFISLKFGAFVAGGADSYGYISQADLWLARDLTIEQPLALQVPWGEPDWTLSPLGYRPSETPGTIVPIYASGLPMMMAAAKAAIGNFGPYLITPVLGAVTVWLTYLLGARVWSPLVGLAAAAWLASSPSFLFMLMSPMSDVPVSAFVTAAVLTAVTPSRWRAPFTGLLAGVAVLIRPNLVPVLAVFGAFVALREGSWRQRLQAIAMFGAAALPFVITIAATNTHLYGAPWKSGYGSFKQLYAWEFLIPNLVRYSRWTVETETPVVAFCVLPFLAWRRLPRERRTAVGFMAAIAAVVWVGYLFYLVFDAWWYLRFLLPALPAMLILAMIGCRLLLSGVPRGYRAMLLAATLVFIVTWQVRYAERHSVHQLCRNESVYVSVGEYVNGRLPRNAIIFSAQHSGSLRYYGERMTLRHDTISRRWWPRAVPVLMSMGLRPYIVLEDSEESAFRAKFGLSDAFDAPGTVMAELKTIVPVKIYDPLRQEPGTDAIPSLEERLCTR